MATQIDTLSPSPMEETSVVQKAETPEAQHSSSPAPDFGSQAPTNDST